MFVELEHSGLNFFIIYYDFTIVSMIIPTHGIYINHEVYTTK